MRNEADFYATFMRTISMRPKESDQLRTALKADLGFLASQKRMEYVIRIHVHRNPVSWPKYATSVHTMDGQILLYVCIDYASDWHY